MHTLKIGNLSDDQIELIDRFLDSFTKIEQYLRQFLKEAKDTKFSDLVREYANQKKNWVDEKTLIMMGDLRNVIIHERFGKKKYLSVPVPDVVEKIEQICEQFYKPKLVFPEYRRDVVFFLAEDHLSDVLSEIVEKDFSQFPIFYHEQFLGLLTENGITRWLAYHSSKVLSLIEIEEVTVKDLFRKEEQRKNYQFIDRKTTIMDAEMCFIDNHLLEALLITEKGHSSETLLGIITRWDMPPH